MTFTKIYIKLYIYIYFMIYLFIYFLNINHYDKIPMSFFFIYTRADSI